VLHLPCAEENDTITGVHKKPIKNIATSNNKYDDNNNSKLHFRSPHRATTTRHAAMKEYSKNDKIKGRLLFLVSTIERKNLTGAIVNQH
jgi:hypothetical protein